MVKLTNLHNMHILICHGPGLFCLVSTHTANLQIYRKQAGYSQIQDDDNYLLRDSRIRLNNYPKKHDAS